MVQVSAAIPQGHITTSKLLSESEYNALRSSVTNVVALTVENERLAARVERYETLLQWAHECVAGMDGDTAAVLAHRIRSELGRGEVE
jgi:hypothetical protein